MTSKQTRETSSWDFTKAFDMIPYGLLRQVYRRAFVPKEVADWLTEIDTKGKIIVRTPFAKHHLTNNRPTSFHHVDSNVSGPVYFEAKAGVAQGDVHVTSGTSPTTPSFVHWRIPPQPPSISPLERTATSLTLMTSSQSQPR
jgi:hypothetical protein